MKKDSKNKDDDQDEIDIGKSPLYSKFNRYR